MTFIPCCGHSLVGESLGASVSSKDCGWPHECGSPPLCAVCDSPAVGIFRDSWRCTSYWKDGLELKR